MIYGLNVFELSNTELDNSEPDKTVPNKIVLEYQQWLALQDYSSLFDYLESEGFVKWSDDLKLKLPQIFKLRHGVYNQWCQSFLSLPEIVQTDFKIDQGYLSIKNSFANEQHEQIQLDLEQFKENLLALTPWRKGPYKLNSITIDTEWRSDYKWDRLKDHISPLQHRAVLDVGCGNGYHCWRMHEAGAKMVLGIDPSWLFLAQFQMVKHFMGAKPVYFLPIGIEDMPSLSVLGDFGAFDTIFSMGVLYHRRSPLDHLFQLKHLLRREGELVLETLIIDGGEGEALLPKNRYAKMRNVWFLPSIKTLVNWMDRCGFINIRVVSVEKTSIKEQHSTEWVSSESLVDFLDPNDDSKTIEGYPAPKRVVIIANKP